MAEKVYLLDPPSLQPRDGHGPTAQKREDRTAKPQVQPRVQPVEQVQQSAPRIELDDVPEAWIKPPSAAGRRAFHPTGTLLALYTLGGIAPLALRVGPRKFAWAAASALSLAGWASLVWYWQVVRGMLDSGRLPILPFLLGLAIVHIVGSIAWTRAVLHVVRDERFRAGTLPRWLRNPWVAGVAGVFMPGSGLAISGRHIRAALAFWNGASVTLAGVLLANAGLVWAWNVKAGADAMPKSFLEGLFIGGAVVACLGGLLWVGTALDGARLAESRRASQRRVREGGAVTRADAVAVGLVAALAAFAMVFHPGTLARDLDRFAGAMRFSGYRIVPLTLETTAATLDPGRPEYAMRVAELHVEMGRPEAARVIHDRLRERWEVYAQMLLQTAAATRSPVPSQPLQPARDLVPRSQELAPTVSGATATAPAAQ